MKVRLVAAIVGWQLCLSLVASGLVAPSLIPEGRGQDSNSSGSSSSRSSLSKKTNKLPPAELDAGVVTNGVYRNRALGLSCNIPAGWVLRTEEMNAREESSADSQVSQNQRDLGHPNIGSSAGGNSDSSGRVLLAAFSRPPEAKGEDVNGSIVIAAEKQSAYPGLTDAVQYLGPLTEVATAQGFVADEDPYEIAIGPKKLVRADFHRDVGSRVMRQSTLVFLAKGYVVSITVIGGTDDDVEELVDGLGFSAK